MLVAFFCTISFTDNKFQHVNFILIVCELHFVHMQLIMYRRPQMENHIWRIYRYYNPAEDKSYVGQTTRNVNDRAVNGKGYWKGSKFRNAIDTYGWETFEQSILRLCTSQEDANYWEQYFIDKFDSINNGYNAQSGGCGGCTLDRHYTDETRRKQSEAKSGKNHPHYGKSWYNNGTINTCINVNTTDIPDGFVKGKIIRRHK